MDCLAQEHGKNCEQWKPVFGDNYEISSNGRFRRLTAGRKTKPGKILKNIILKIGYPIVNPVIDGKNKMFYVHHLVAENFIGPKPPGHEINHKDGNKANPKVSNLEYVTHAQNMKHAADSGLLKGHRKHPESTIKMIISLRKKGYSYSHISKMTGVAIGWCWQVVNGGAKRCNA